MVARVRPAVALIVVRSHEGFSNGSGFIYHVDEDGSAYILTNQHVVDEWTDILVGIEDSRLYGGEVLYVDTRRDIAMLRICCGEFTTVEFADSMELMPGDEVVAIGYAEFFAMPSLFRPGRVKVRDEATVTRGIISAFRYYTPMDAELAQHDAPINGGNSGGPLFTLDGLVVGMNTFGMVDRPALGISRDGLGFAVLETTVQERLRLWAKGPKEIFGPVSGRLQHEVDGYIKVWGPWFWADSDEFVLSATFTNPHRWNGHQWDYGFNFGRSGTVNDEYLYFVVDWRKHWHIAKRNADGSLTRLHDGTVPQLNTGMGQKNRLDLYVDGRFADLYVNGERVSLGAALGKAQRINLGGEDLTSHEGRVAIITGYWNGSERNGWSTRYEGFMGWTYDHQAE